MDCATNADACAATRVGQENQRQKTRNFGVVGQEASQHSCEVEGSFHEIHLREVLADR